MNTMTGAQRSVVEAMKAGAVLLAPMRRGMRARLQKTDAGRPVAMATVAALEAAGLIAFNGEGWSLV